MSGFGRISLALFGALALSLGACGGKDKKGSVSATGSAGGSADGSGLSASGGDPANMDPQGGVPGADGSGSGSDSGTGTGTGTGTGSGAGPAGPAGSGSGDGPPPEVKPPGLDIAPAEKQRRVDGHLKTGYAAVGGTSTDPDRAIREARAALEVDETNVPAMVLLAHGNYIKGYLDLSEDILNKAIERGGKNNKQAHFLLGLIYERTERDKQAPAAYQRAVALDPNYKSALLNLGVHLIKNHRFEEAVRTYERLTGELGVNSAAVWTNLATSYRGHSADFVTSDAARRNQLLLKAEQNYRRAISLDKNYARAYYNMGLLYLDAEPFPEGTGEMEKLKRIRRAKTYFDEYRRLPGADVKLVDQTSAVAQKLIDKEELLRKKQAEREAKRKAAEEKAKAAKEKPAELDDSDEGFE